MKLFSEDSICVKCGNDKHIGVYYAQGYIYDGFQTCLKHLTGPFYRGHIHRSCERCGYVWVEEPLDAQGSPEV